MNTQSQGLPPTEDETKNKQFHLANTGETLNIRAVEGAVETVSRQLTTPASPPVPAASSAGPGETYEQLQRRWSGR